MNEVRKKSCPECNDLMGLWREKGFTPRRAGKRSHHATLVCPTDQTAWVVLDDAGHFVLDDLDSKDLAPGDSIFPEDES